MPEKLMTLQELSDFLGVPDELIIKLVDERIIPAYKIGGELLRFRKEQIEAMRHEIDSRTGKVASVAGTPAIPPRKIMERNVSDSENSFIESAQDFFYFNDFYILSAAIVGILLAIIFRG